MEDGVKNGVMQEDQELVTKRVKSKGHYRLVTRDKKTGRIVSVSKWSPESKKASENTGLISPPRNKETTE